MISTNYNGEDVFVFWYPAQREPGSLSVSMDVALPAKVGAGLSGREERSPMGETLRLQRLECSFLLFYEQGQELNRALRFGHTTERILVPFWPLARPTAEYAALPIKGAIAATYEADGLYPAFGDGYEIHGGDAPVGAFANGWTVPLLYCQFEERPGELNLLTDESSYLTVSFVEDCEPAEGLQWGASAFANGPALADASTPKVFPAFHDWASPVVTGSRLRVDFERKGQGRRLKPEYHGAYSETPIALNCRFDSVQGAVDLLDFFRQMGGVSDAFWVPQYLADARLTAAADALDTSVFVEDAAGVALHQWIAIRTRDGAAYRKVTGIDGNELLLDAPLGIDIPYYESSLSSLILARFEKEVLRLGWSTDQDGRAQVRVIETSAEYVVDAAEERGVTLGALPVRTSIIVFSGDGITWAYCPYEGDVNYSGGTASRINIEHSDISLGLRLRDTVSIDSYLSECEPLRRFHDLELDELDVRIIRADVAAGVASNEKQIFSGRCGAPESEGDEVSVSAEWLGHLFAAKVPRRMLQRTCQKRFCGPSCGLDISDWTFTAEIVDAGVAGWPYQVTIGNITRDNLAANPVFFADWFAWGTAWVGDGSFLKTQFIAASSAIAAGEIILTLDGDFDPYPVNGATIKLQAECNQLENTCKAYHAVNNPLGKFNNYAEFSGVRQSKGNLSLIKVSGAVGGGKK